MSLRTDAQISSWLAVPVEKKKYILMVEKWLTTGHVIKEVG